MVSNIKRICRERNIKLRELERRADFPRGSVYKWDTHTPNITKVKAVADILGVTIDDLIKEED